MDYEKIILSLFSRVVECDHSNLRCVHGDEIITRGGARTACLDCGTSLGSLDMPRVCHYTGKEHVSYWEGN